MSDGTQQGTQQLNGTATLNVEARPLAIIDGSLYFSADAGAGNKNQPYQFKIATNQLISMGNLSPAGLDAKPANFQKFGDKIVFSARAYDANNNWSGFKLYSWNGQQSTAIISPFSYEFKVVTLGGTQYVAFTSYSLFHDTLGLWDGTNPWYTISGSAAGGLFPDKLTPAADGLYFLGVTSLGVNQLCLLTGPNPSDLRENINGATANVSDLISRQSDGSVWFVSDRIGVEGNRVLTTIDGGATVRQILNGKNSLTSGPTAVGNTIYFAETMFTFDRIVHEDPPPTHCTWEETNRGVELGTYTEEPAPKIKGTTWLDANFDGIDQGAETNLADVQETLFDASGNAVVYTNSVADGSYSFNYLPAGTYTVEFAPPAGDAFTKEYQGSDPVIDSDADGGGDTAPISITSGGSTTIENAGLVQMQSISGRVWADVNRNGLQDGSEAGVGGVLLTLYDNLGNVLGTTTSAADGAYSFTGLIPGATYQVGVQTPANTALTNENIGADTTIDSDFDPLTGLTTLLVVGNQPIQYIDAGLIAYGTASVSGQAWLDANGDGIRETGEAALAGIEVHLIDATTGVTLLVTTTDSNGNYSFANVPAGTYRVAFTAPANYTFAPADQGSDDAVDSDADAVTGETGPITLTAGQNNTTTDVGLIQVTTSATSVSGRVWDEVNGDGIQDAGETGRGGVTLNLYDDLGMPIGSAFTDTNGAYSFSGVLPGSYRIGVAPPPGTVLAPMDQGVDDTIDSDIDPISALSNLFLVASGQAVEHLDAGLANAPAPASISGQAWLDDGDGIRETGEGAFAGIEVRLVDAVTLVTIAVTTTDSNGNYSFTNVQPGTYRVAFTAPAGYMFSPADQGSDDTVDSDVDAVIGETAPVTLTAGQNNTTTEVGLIQVTTSVSGRVWDDVNGNGIQDAEETGHSGVTLTLYDEQGVPIDMAVTDAIGAYSFTGVVPGSYRIGVAPPPDTALTAVDQGADNTINSDFDPMSALSGLFIVSNEPVAYVDTGLIDATAGVSGQAWFDDGDGIRETGEGGFAGVVVRLVDAVTLVTIAITTTASDGSYSFANVPPGSYYIEFCPPASYVFTLQDQGSDDYVDSDVNPATFQTSVFTLDPFENLSNIDAALIYNP